MAKIKSIVKYLWGFPHFHSFNEYKTLPIQSWKRFTRQYTVDGHEKKNWRNRPSGPFSWQLELFVPVNITLCACLLLAQLLFSLSLSLCPSSMPFLFGLFYPARAAVCWLRLLKLEIWAHYVNRCYRQWGEQAWDKEQYKRMSRGREEDMWNKFCKIIVKNWKIAANRTNKEAVHC